MRGVAIVQGDYASAAATTVRVDVHRSAGVQGQLCYVGVLKAAVVGHAGRGGVCPRAHEGHVVLVVGNHVCPGQRQADGVGPEPAA